jgi:serine/threonine protein kinase
MTAQPSEKLSGLEDGYDQIQLKAVGGMAEVYRARQKNLDRPVAVKRIRPELRSNKDIQERFRREAKSSANLLHQNLAHVYDYRKIQDDAFIIMEWIDGFDVAEILERVGPLPIDVACLIAIRVLRGLTYVHSHGLVHRDLKPDNVRISVRGDVKIMDFGIALDPSEGNLTLPGTLIGSPHYLSPEQVRGEKIDLRSDLFSFGITFYEMLTAKRPFFETQKETVYGRIQKGEYIDPNHIRPEIPKILVKIVAQCLEVKTSKRPKNAEVILGSLSQFVSSQFTSDSEARIRKYLIEKSLVAGNAQMIAIPERTNPGLNPKVVIVDFRKMKAFVFDHGLTLLIVLLGALLVWVIATRSSEPVNDLAGEDPAAVQSTDPGSGPRVIKPRNRNNQDR